MKIQLIVTLNYWKKPITSARKAEEEIAEAVDSPQQTVAGWMNDFTEKLAAVGKGNPTGANQYSGNTDNVSISTELFTEPEPAKKKADAGNSRAYTLSRLHRERPDLFEMVVQEEMSANAAALDGRTSGSCACDREALACR